MRYGVAGNLDARVGGAGNLVEAALAGEAEQRGQPSPCLGTLAHALDGVRAALLCKAKGASYCSGPMKNETFVIPAKDGIQCWRGFTSWTPGSAFPTVTFAGVTTSYSCGPD